jgi:VCBS repeat-containing protein
MSKSTRRSSKRSRYTLLLIFGLIALVVLAQQIYFASRVRAASPFTAGNLVVYRVGDGVSALVSAATPVFLDEYTPAGVLVQTIAVPTTTSGSNRALTASGTATSEGLLTRSIDGQFLTLTGYNAAVGTASITSSASGTVNRVIGRVDNAGTIDTTTALGDAISGGNPRSAVSTNGSDIWISGTSSGGGIRYATLGATTSTALNTTTVTNLRQANIFNGQLYVSSQSGAFRLSTVGTGTPTTSGQTITNLPGYTTSTTSPYGFFFADLNVGVAGVDTLYVADDNGAGGTGGIQKYSLISGSWVSNGSVAATGGLRGLTGTVSGTTVTLYITASTGTNGTLFKLTDTSGYNAANNGTLSSLATAGANRAFRGVALAPSTPNQAIVPNCPASLNTVQGVAASTGVSASDPDGTVTSASITSAAVPGITLDGFTPAPSSGGTANATLNVANTTAAGTYNVVIQYSNNDSPTPQTATCTVVVTVTPPNQPINPNCPTPLTTTEGTATSEGVSATDPDGIVTSATITSAPVAGITLDNFTPAPSNNTAATATLNVANTTAPGTYNVVIQYSNNDSPTPQTANCTVVVTVNPPPTPATVVISQVYGGGGNTGSDLKNDYIEIINHSSTPVDLSGWSVQHLPTSGSTWSVTPLTNFILQPGQYYLIQESQGAGGTDNLPTPDAIGTITVSSTSGKVALVSNTTTLTGTCPSGSGIVDFVGYGNTSGNTANCFEGSGPVPTLSNTTAALRKNDGCFDTDDNANDFVVGGPTPHNSSSPFNDCTGLSGFGSANPTSVVVGGSTTLTVHVAPAQDPTSTGITVTADLSQIGGSANQVFGGGPNTFTFAATVPANNPTGVMSLPVTIQDAQFRVANTNITVKVLPVIPDHVTISQLYGGGGNSGATYNHDYVELYNPHTSTFDLTGWSLQYSSATGDTWQVQPLGGTIAPGEYYLIGLATNNSGVGIPLPPANISGDINMSATTGKIALVNNFDALAGPCPIADTGVVDFLGYGTTANCAEGTRAAAPSATTALFRKNGGATDTDNNSADFVTGAPNPRRTAPIVEIGPSVFSTDPRNGATTAPRDATITLSFTEPVSVDSGWYDINCVSTGNHNIATVRSFFGDDTYTITPNVNFLAGEQCTVTIFKDAIHDVDTDDTGTNADSLPANKVFSFTVATGTAPPYPASVHLTMGNPSGADLIDQNNYLMEKPEFSLSYNRSRGTPNWVSSHLSDEWVGTLARVDTFRADPAVPDDWFRVSAFDYVGSGFDRGHMVPNADRDKQTSIPINQATFLMTNMIPQAPDNNQGPWANLEGYLRTLLPANEIYIVAGGAGTGGTGSNGAANTIAGSNVTVPAQTWKVALIIPKASGDDAARVDCSTRTLAVIMPNVQGIRTNPWETYITTVDAVESLTGYDFFSNLPDAVENCVEAGTNGANSPATANQSASTAEDTPVEITLQAVRPNTNPLTFSIVTGPANGSLGSSGAPSCTDHACSATVTYTPGSNYNGPDSFTFKVNDGTVDSNTSTVAITVNPFNDDPDAVDDEATVAEDSGANTVNVRANDTDVDGDTLTVTAVTQGTNGSVVITNGGADVSYTPNANFFGTDTFTYTVSDGNGGTDTATVTVTVTNVEDAPDAVNDATTIAEDSGANAIDVRANDSDVDGDTLTVTAVTQGTHGSVAISGEGTEVSYTPNANFFGSDSFTYTVSDGNGGTDTATVNVTITNVDDAPVATNDSYVTNSNTALNVPAPGVLSNDSDIDGPSLSAQLVSNVSHGTLSLNADGSFSYTPAVNFEGTDSFTYHAFDGTLYSNTVTVTITVNDTVAPVLTSSVAISLISSTNSNLVNVGLTASATDNSGDPVLIQVGIFGDEDDQTPTFHNTVFSPDAKDIAPVTLRLRGERVEDDDGRVYLIVITATDSSGNISRNYHTVVVPKSNKQANIDSVNAQAAVAAAYAQSHDGTPPPGYFVIGDGPVIGPKQ